MLVMIVMNVVNGKLWMKHEKLIKNVRPIPVPFSLNYVHTYFQAYKIRVSQKY